MLAGLLGAGISGAFGLIGQNKQNKANRAINAQNIQLQKDFAQQGIQWRVADAKAAGIHPLAALGAQTHSYAPQSIGMDYSAMGRMGQDIGRAVQTATRSAQGKQLALYNDKVRALNLKHMELRNAALASEIAKNNQAGQVPRTGVGGGMLVDGQPDSGPSTASVPGVLVKDLPQRRTVSNPERLWETPAAVPDYTWVRSKYGYTRIPSRDVKQGIEDMLPLEVQWMIRNNVIPMYQKDFGAPNIKLKKGHRWKMRPWGPVYQSPRPYTWERYRR